MLDPRREKERQVNEMASWRHVLPFPARPAAAAAAGRFPSPVPKSGDGGAGFEHHAVIDDPFFNLQMGVVSIWVIVTTW